ncbi:MAG: hypothetical protein NVSMB25_02180 [Thermoleophilaceae bacterium]
MQAILRALAVCLVCAAGVAICGGAGAFWLCLPAALLLAAPASNGAGEALGAMAAVIAGAAPELLWPSLGPLPPIPLIATVVASSVGILHALRKRLGAERELLRASALSDPLTGAANRRGLAELADYEVVRHTRQRTSFAVVALDLDGFKLVNDRFGHPAGDELLRDVADALRRVVREQDTVARLGGDEFCVLAPETDSSGAQQLTARIEVAISRVTAGVESLSASVGFALFPADGADSAAVMKAADAAQVQAKRRMRGARGRRAA